MIFEKIRPNIIGTICAGCDKTIPHNQSLWIATIGPETFIACSVRCQRVIVVNEAVKK